jgi:hypothetical protein
VANDPVELQQLIRFSLGVMGEENRHHDFEAICLGIARRRIVSNLLPATGPVSSGGDQGRDAESHWSDVAGSSSLPRAFVALASEDRVVMACTTQQEDVPWKIRSDLKSITEKGTPVRRVLFFASTPIPVAKRHDLINHARSKYEVDLEIFDVLAIAAYLTDHDLFYLAVHYLHLPSDLAPPHPEGIAMPDWYAQLRERWWNRPEAGTTLGDLVDLRIGLRHATFHAEAHPDLPEWIRHTRALLAATSGLHTGLRARYEIVVAVLRGLDTIRDDDILAREFFDAVINDPDMADAGLLEDAIVLLGYVGGAMLRQLTGIRAGELSRWRTTLIAKLNLLIDTDPYNHALARYLGLAARMALTPRPPEPSERPENQELISVADTVELVRTAADEGKLAALPPVDPAIIDLDTAMELLTRLGRHLPVAPLYPVGSLCDLLDLYVATLITHPSYDEVRNLFDAAHARAEGGYAVGVRAQNRALSLLEQDRPLLALREVHKAIRAWMQGETLEGGLLMLLLAAKVYGLLGLPVAAKHYALAASVAARGDGPDLASFVGRGIIEAAGYDHQAGNWLTAGRVLGLGLPIHLSGCTDPFDADQHPFVWHMIGNQALAARTARTLRPEYLPLIESGMTSGTDLIVDQILSTTDAASIEADADLATSADEEGIGRPFSDAGAVRTYRWHALGVAWKVRTMNERRHVLAAERFISALQITLADLAVQDPLFMPGEQTIEVFTDPQLPLTETQTCRADTVNTWQVRLADADQYTTSMEEDRQLLSAVLQTLVERSLLTGESFMKLIDMPGADGLLTKVFMVRPYDELADLHPADFYETLRTLPAPPAAEHPDLGPAIEQLPARQGPGPGYDPAQGCQAAANRYHNLQPTVRYTLPRLLKDPAFRITVASLRKKGWLDWHLLLAVSQIVANSRLHLNSNNLSQLSAEERSRIAEELFRPEEPTDTQLPATEFHETALRKHLQISAFSTASALGLSPPAGPHAENMLRLLGERYGYWTDDAEHQDLFPVLP